MICFPNESVYPHSPPSQHITAVPPESSSPGTSEIIFNITPDFEGCSLHDSDQNESPTTNISNPIVQQPSETLGRPSRTHKVTTYLRDDNYSLPKL